MKMNFKPTSPVFLLFFLFISTATSFNITSILGNFPDFSVFNGYLTQTGLAVEINSRSPITVLATNNDAIAVLSQRNFQVDSIERILSLHVVLDYYDQNKLKQSAGRSSLLTTLFQTTGAATGQQGFLNATYLNDGDIVFGSGVRGSSLTSKFVKLITSEPRNLSVIQISSVIIPPGFENASTSASPVNITSTLMSSGFRSFTEMLQSTGVLPAYMDAENNGLTIFAPIDKAIHVLPTNLTNDERKWIALYHAVGGYHPLQYLMRVTGPLSTLASNGNSNFQITVKTTGQSVTLNSGLNTVNVGRTIIDQQQVVIYEIDAALQPPEIFASNGSLPPPSNTPPSPPAPAAPAPTPPSSGGSPPASSPAASPPASPTADSPPADVQPQTPASSPPDVSSAARSYISCTVAALSIFYRIVV
ncbi:unnamed protein product [Victoria cruziana]